MIALALLAAFALGWLAGRNGSPRRQSTPPTFAARDVVRAERGRR